MTTINKALIERKVEEFIEKGADIEHTRWAKWQKYFFSKCSITTSENENNATLVLPLELLKRWKRQIATPYSELSESEKESDRREVRSYEPLLTATLTTLSQDGYERGRKEVVDAIEELEAEDTERKGYDFFSSGFYTPQENYERGENAGYERGRKEEGERVVSEMHKFFPVPDMTQAEMWPRDEQVRWASIGEVMVKLADVVNT